MLIEPGGGIVTVSEREVPGTLHFQFGATRVDDAGHLDPSFGSGGTATTSLAGNDDKAVDAASLPERAEAPEPAMARRGEKDGQIESFEAYLLDPHGGDIAGFFLIHGERSALDALKSSTEFKRLLVRAGSVIDNLGLVSAYSGDALGQQMALFGEIAQELPQAK